jgi:menaquinone-specific isochorismate synthase
MDYPTPADARQVPALDRLRAAVCRRLATAGGAQGAFRVVRVEVPLEPVDALAWLAAQPFAEKAYWHGRGEDESRAAVGVADVCSDLATLQQRLDGLAVGSRARYVGGMRFAPGAARPMVATSEWSSFGEVRFVLPRFELVTSGGTATLAAHLVLPRDTPEVLAADLGRLRFDPPATCPDLPLPTARADAPDAPGWRRRVEEALEAIAAGECQKVVLARCASLDFEGPLDPLVLLTRLQAATPGCFHFALQPALGVTFVGATPERLFRLDGQRLQTEALAGTRPRPPVTPAAERLRADLLASDKDHREHAFVRDSMLAALAPFGDVAPGRTEAIGLATKWHLRTAIAAEVAPGARPLDLLRALHPTPAVAGTPTDVALARIAATEPFDRGWYAGPVGWVSADAAEFAVAIRSGLVLQRNGASALHLYSGAGIVAGSDPDAEWDEIEDKVVDFARALGLGG